VTGFTLWKEMLIINVYDDSEMTIWQDLEYQNAKKDASSVVARFILGWKHSEPGELLNTLPSDLLKYVVTWINIAFQQEFLN